MNNKTAAETKLNEMEKKGEMTMNKMNKACQILENATNVEFDALYVKSTMAQEEENALVAIAKKGGKKGEEARNMLVEANMGVVISVAKKFRKVANGFWEDLCQEGYLALLDAHKKFDPSRGARFASFAYFVVLKAIVKKFNEEKRIPPESAKRLLEKIDEKNEELCQRNWRKPSSAEVCEAAGVSEKQYDALAKKYGTQVLSLNEPCGQEDDSFERVDLIPSNNADDQDPAAIVEKRELVELQKKTLTKNVNKLDSVERKILKMRYPNNGGPEMSFKEIGKKLGLSHETVRKSYNQALKTLQNNPELRAIAEKKWG